MFKPRSIVLAVFALLAFNSLPGTSRAELSVEGQLLLWDGKPFDMWGIRTASASQSQELTDHLIAQLDDYVAHGVNSVSVYYMGSSGGYSDPFSADGKSVDQAHQARLNEIITACNARNMVVIVGIFYQRSEAPSLQDWEACQAAVETATRELQSHRNVIINVANEQNSQRYAAMPWANVRDVPKLLELCRLVKRIDPARIVGAGGYDHDKNEQIGLSSDVDVLLFDTAGPTPHSGELYQRFVAAGIRHKPLINVETFGAWTAQFSPQGVFPDRAKEIYLNEVQQAAEHPGLYLHFHNNPWCQTPGEEGRIRYDLGGSGTADDPGIRWYFEAVKSHSD